MYNWLLLLETNHLANRLLSGDAFLPACCVQCSVEVFFQSNSQYDDDDDDDTGAGATGKPA